MRKFLILAFAIFVSNIAVFAQQTASPKWSANLNFGVPVTLFSLKSDLAGFTEFGARYSFTKSFSGEVSYNMGGFAHSAGGTARTGVVSPDGKVPTSLPAASDVYAYNNKINILNLRANYSLYKMLGLEAQNSKWAPYATAGLGLSFWKIHAVLQDGRVMENTKMQFRPMYMWQLGLGTRYYLNPQVDLNGGVLFNYVESYWMDAAPQDKSLDHFLMVQFGVSYKIKANQNHNLIDWSGKNVADVPGMPKDYSRWSGDVNIGLPYLFTKVGSGLGAGLGLGGRYSFSRVFSLQAGYNYLHFGGSQTASNLAPIHANPTPESIKEFSTNISQLSLRARFNLTQMLLGESEQMRKFNLYALAGTSINFFGSKVTMSDGYVNDYIYAPKYVENKHIGLEGRYYFNKAFDFIGAVEYHNNQTRWYDGAPAKNDLNNHLYISAGVSYKFGEKLGIELIDWSYTKYDRIRKAKEKKLADVPVIQPKPVVEEVKPVVEPAEVKKEEPAPVVEPAPVKKEEPAPVVEPKPAPKPEIIKEVKPVQEVKPAVIPAPANDEITAPPFKYNVVVACYGLNHKNLALKFRDKMRDKGFESTQVYRSNGSKWLRVTTISTDEKSESTQVLRKSRSEIDPQSWIHLYNKQ